MKINKQQQEILIIVFMVIGLTIALATLPLPFPDDWQVYSGTAHRLIAMQPLYDEPVVAPTFFFFNPPWLAILIAPFGLLPFRIGYALTVAASIIVLVLLSQRYKISPIKTAAILASPPMFYTILHGQIDIIVLGGILLPTYLWPLVSLTKPQITLALIFGIQKDQWVKSAVVFSIVVGLSLLLFGLWPLKIIENSGSLYYAGHNIWSGLSPLQMVAGVALVFMGINRKDDRFLISASPFFSPYIATSSLIGPTLVMTTFLKDWQAVIVVVAWWAVIASRILL